MSTSETITRTDLKNILDEIVLINKDIIGEIRMYSGSTAPTGWLFCDGSAISRTDYSDLFDVIGTTYGDGDGSTTFNLPNMKGRFPVGVGSIDAGDSGAESYWGGTTAGAVNCPLGQRAGEAWHKLVIAEMPRHHHENTGNNTDWNSWTSGGVDSPYYTSHTSQGRKLSEWIQYEGNDQAHNNMPPFIAINFIICVE